MDDNDRAGRPTTAPVSFAQRSLWFLDQYLPRRAAYNVPGVYEIAGDVRVDVLRAALAEVMRRHEPLRTGIGDDLGRPVQLVRGSAEVDVPLRVHEFTGPLTGQRWAEIRGIAEAEMSMPFALDTPPLWRVVLAHGDQNRHVLVITLHHIVADGWSLSIVLDELVACYAAIAAGTAIPLPEPAATYTEVVVRQRDRLTGARLDALTGFWRSALHDAPAVLALPTDRPRPAVASYQGDAVDFVVPDELYGRVRDLAARLRTSPFVVLLAAFAVLLRDLGGQDDIVLGTPTAGRTDVDAEELVGYFANTLPLRVDCAGDPSFTDLVGRARTTTLDALDHGELPFELIVEAVGPVRDRAHHPVFQVLFALTDLPPDRSAPGLRISSHPPSRNGTAKFDLSLMLFIERDRLGGTAEFATDLFDRATIVSIVDEMLALLRRVVDDPDTPLVAAGRPVHATSTMARAVPEHPTPAHTPLEKDIAEIWCAVLGIDDVGVHDDFFALGGHSLLATQVVARTRALGVGLDLATFFALPTIADIACAVESGAIAPVRLRPITPRRTQS